MSLKFPKLDPCPSYPTRGLHPSLLAKPPVLGPTHPTDEFTPGARPGDCQVGQLDPNVEPTTRG